MVRQQIEKQLLATGNSPFKIQKIDISGRIGFLPIRVLNGIRRGVLTELTRIRLKRYHRETAILKTNSIPYPARQLDYHANVLNRYARRFYERHGAEVMEPAFEILPEKRGREVMKTRYCLRYEVDACLKSDPSCRRIEEPLRIGDGRHQYLLKFDCEACKMSVIFLGEIQKKQPALRRSKRNYQ